MVQTFPRNKKYIAWFSQSPWRILVSGLILALALAAFLMWQLMQAPMSEVAALVMTLAADSGSFAEVFSRHAAQRRNRVSWSVPGGVEPGLDRRKREADVLTRHRLAPGALGEFRDRLTELAWSWR
jgi:hypothetical protein